MYDSVRIIIGVVLGFWWLLIAPKITKEPLKRRTSIAIIIFDIVLITVLSFIPFENLIYTFKSPEAAFKYYDPTVDKVELVVEGDESDFVLGIADDTSTITILPKTADGWKIGAGLGIRRVTQENTDGFFITVYRYMNTNDHFISIRGTQGGELAISDEYETKFHEFSMKGKSDPFNRTFFTYYAYVANFDSQYSVTVNGNEIVLKNY